MSAEVVLKGVDFGALAQQLISTEITKALAQHDEVVGTIIAKALQTRVNSKGERASSYDRETYTELEYMAISTIREATKRAIKDKIESMQPELERAIGAALMKSKGSLAKHLANVFVNQLKEDRWISLGITMDIGERVR